jgi:hypothetical protein
MPALTSPAGDAETQRLQDDARRDSNWKRWGPYLSERQWGTVREDYSEWGSCWDYLPHDHARSRAYRWGEDGLMGITDRQCRLCLAVALWNGKDPILKERLFGLTGDEGNHAEDVKELYYYLDATPTHSYLKGLYKYPLSEFPYARLVEENRRRGKHEREFELLDTGVFEQGYVDVFVEYAKAAPDDLLLRLTLANRSGADATLDVLPTLWFRNTWSWGRSGEGFPARPRLSRTGDSSMLAEHATLGRFRWDAAPAPDGRAPELLFTENETNAARLFGAGRGERGAKDAFHEYVIGGRREALNADGAGTKAAFRYRLRLPAGEAAMLWLRLGPDSDASEPRFGAKFSRLFDERCREADAFHQQRLPEGASPEARRAARQAYAGLLWSKQFYYYVVKDWLEGDPTQPPPPAPRRKGRNAEWPQLFNRDVISMPDKWEYPWFAAWDLAFHMIPFAELDPEFAKQQLVLFLREWYMHPNGQLPACEFNFSDVNPPVHAWACWRIYKMTGPRGQRDRTFLARTFNKLLLNFTWWVNRKDDEGNNLFSGGFLGLDNIGLFDRSRPLPGGGHLEQADGTAWMAFYCATMLAMALELARDDPAYEDMASKFFEHFVAITDAMNGVGGTGLWDEQDGFYYDQIHADGEIQPLRVRSMVGLVPLFAVEVLEDAVVDALPGFKKRLAWFLENRKDLARHISYLERAHGGGRLLLAVPSRERLQRVLSYVLDEQEFLAPTGVRSLSRHHLRHPYSISIKAERYSVEYAPAESTTVLFGGNSNWRGPVWFPVNYLLLEALERYHHFYGDALQVEFPKGSGNRLPLDRVARELARRLVSTFLPDAAGHRPCHGGDPRYAEDPHFKDLVLFYEYFCGDTGRGVGASHQTGWTGLFVSFLRMLHP